MRAGTIVSRSAACLALAVSMAWAGSLAGPAQAAELYRIAGRVTTGQDKPLPGVIVRFSNGSPTAVTDQEGRYVAIVPAGVQQYTVTPLIGGYTLEPGQARVWISGADAEADFRAVFAPQTKPGDSQVGVLDTYNNCLPVPRGTEQVVAVNSSSTTPNPGHAFLRVYLQAGKKYAFETYGAAAAPQCEDTIMSLCQSWSPTKGPSAIVATSDDSIDRESAYSTIVYAPASSGYYYIWIHGFAGATGYVAFKYDYAFTYLSLAVNKTVKGCVNDSALAPCPGHALYRVALLAGTTYTIETSAAAAAPRCADTVLSLTSRFDALVGSYDVVGSDDNKSGIDLYSRIIYRPAVSRPYYILVRGAYGDGGYFNLRVSLSLVK